MIWLYVALLILIILIVILFLPLNVVVRYPEVPNVEILILGIKLNVFNNKNSFDKSKNESLKSGNSENKIFEAFKKRGFVKSFKMMYDILNACSEVFAKLMKKFSVNKVKLLVKVGAPNAFSAAIRYGQASAVVYPFMSAVNCISSPKDFKVEVMPDFLGEKITSEFEINVSSNIFRIFCVVFFAVKKYRELYN